MNLFEKTIFQKIVFDGKIINLKVDKVVLPNGKTAEREVVEHPGGVCVLALDEEDNVFVVKQFRYPYKKVLYELPAGKIDNGENPLDCGKRELKEEVGITAKKYTFLGQVFPSPGYCGEIIYLFMATQIAIEEGSLDEDEFLEVEKIPLKTLAEMVLSGKIEDAKTQIAVLKAERLKGQIK